MMNKLVFTFLSFLLSFQLVAETYNPWSFQLHYEYNARPATPWNPEVVKPVRELTTFIRQRLPLSPQLVNSIEEWRNERVDHQNRLNEIEQQKFELMQEMSSFLSGGTFNNLPPHLRATPIPATMTSEQALKPLKPLFDSLENSEVVKSVEEVNKLIKEIALKKSLGQDSVLTNFLESEIKREMVNNAGIVRHLPFAPVPERPFRSDLWTPRGSALVQKTNELLASQSSLSQDLKSECLKGHCLDERKALVNDRRLYERTKTLIETLALSDSLRSLGRNSSRVDQLVQQEIDLLNELSKNLPPEQALAEYFQYVAKGQRDIIQELERIGYENLINFTRPVEFDESHLGDHLLNSEDQLLLKNARLSECINSHELCRSRTELASEIVPPVLGSDGVELGASIAHRGLRETLNVRNKLQSSTITHVEAGNISQRVLTSASQSFADLDNETGTSLLEAGQMIADIALGMTPGVSVVKDIYELVSGKNLVTGETLTQTDLVIAGVGVLTLGLANPIKNGVKFLKALHIGAETTTVISKTLNTSLKLVDKIGAEKFTKILKTPKGARLNPEQYLPTDYIEAHLKQFDDGATRFMKKSQYEKFGVAQADGTAFVLPKYEADKLLSNAGGNREALEDALGYPRGTLDNEKLVRIDISRPRQHNARIPSGNEPGANDLWIPGGKLPNGNSEVVLDLGNVSTDAFTITDI